MKFTIKDSTRSLAAMFTMNGEEPWRALSKAWNDEQERHANASLDERANTTYRLLNVQMKLVSDGKPYFGPGDVHAIGVIGETMRFTLPLLSDHGPDGDCYDVLGFRDVGFDKLERHNGWTLHGLEIPVRQSFRVEVRWQADFRARWAEISGPKRIDIYAEFEMRVHGEIK